MNSTGEGSIHVLHVDDEPGLAGMVAEFLRNFDSRLDVEPLTDPIAAIDRFEGESFDAIVSDYDMPQMNGLELLDSVRETDSDLPFILYTGKGSEEIASEAITRGVTEYMQKDSGNDQYEVLANRIINSVERYRAKRSADAARRRFKAIFERAFDAMIIADDDGRYLDVNSATCDLFGRSEADLLGNTAEDFTVEDFDFSTAWETFKSSDAERGLYPVRRPDGEIRIAEYAATTNIQPGEHLSVLRDVTDQQKVERQVEMERQRLEEFAGVLSHDLKNPVSIAQGHLELLQNGATEAERSEHLDAIEDAVSRIEHVIGDVLAISSSNETEVESVPVSVSDVATDVWDRVKRGADHAEIEAGIAVRAAEGHVERLLTNLFRNTIEHGGSAVRVELGSLDDGTGFFIEDDGPGIPLDERGAVFDWKHSTKASGTGIGLRSVKQIVEAEGWSIVIAEGSEGGARFEISV
jgi:PAS domain S-box-containing protein